MPNHITNIMEFDCSVPRFVEIAESLKSNPSEPLGQVDFNRVIPMPSCLDIEAGSRGETGYRAYRVYMRTLPTLPESERAGYEQACRAQFASDPGIWELGKQYYENVEKYGCPNWYDWCIQNWNTKWNAYECIPVSPADRRLEFLTAWSAVPSILGAISRKFPDVPIRYAWADENIGYNVGRVRVERGKLTDENIPEGGSRKAFELSAEILGGDLTEYGLTLSQDGTTYEYHEPEPEPAPAKKPVRSGGAR